MTTELENRPLGEVERGTATSAPIVRRGTRRFAVPIIVVAVPVLAIALYSTIIIGNPAANVATPPAISAGVASRAVSGASSEMQTMVAPLLARLQKNPRDANGWSELARLYGTMWRYDDAAAAFAKADALTPNDAQLLADYADAVAMTQGKRLAGRPSELIRRALSADSNNLKALTLAGSAAIETKAYPKAVAIWQHALRRVAPGSAAAGMLNADIADARRRGGLLIETAAETPAAMSAEARVGSVPVVTHATIQGRVRLIAELASKASPDDTVIVIARAVSGSAAPLAVIKRQVKDLPLNFTLDDSMAVAPQSKLSAFTQVNISARISKSNAVGIQHGDLVSEPIHTVVGAANVDIPIRGVVR